MSTTAAEARALTNWTEVFVAFENNLSQWMVHTAEAPAASVPPAALTPSPLFEERLQRMQAYLDRAERDAEQALAPLTAEIQALRQWLETLSLARAKLVERTVELMIADC